MPDCLRLPLWVELSPQATEGVLLLLLARYCRRGTSSDLAPLGHLPQGGRLRSRYLLRACCLAASWGTGRGKPLPYARLPEAPPLGGAVAAGD